MRLPASFLDVGVVVCDPECYVSFVVGELQLEVVQVAARDFPDYVSAMLERRTDIFNMEPCWETIDPNMAHWTENN